MKNIITLFMIISSISVFGQTKYALLDRAYHKDVIFTDSITKNHIKVGYYPVQTDQLDSLLTFVGVFRKINKIGLDRTYFNNNDYKTRNITFDITNVPHAYGDNYDIYIISNTDFGSYKLRLSDNTEQTYITQHAIKDFYSYLQKAIKQRDKAKKN